MSKKPYVKPQILVEEWKVWRITKSSNQYLKKGIYEVSNFGRAKHNGEPVKFLEQNGYLKIGNKLLHRIVAELFIPNPENKPEIDHIDTNKANNVYWNLRWVDRKENMNNPITKINQSNSMKGKTPWNKGKTWELDTRNKISGKCKGRKAPNKGKHRVYNDPNNYKSGCHYE